jgi:hypothetical protein
MSLEREIEELLAVDHSPEFPARVRARVAVEPPPSAWRVGWKLLPGVALAAIALAVIMWPPAERAVVNGTAAPEPVALEAPVGGTTLPVARAPAAPPRRTVTVARVPRPRDEPEILLSAEETRAFRMLLTQLQRGRIPEMAPAAPVDGAGGPLGPPWIEIAPVEITPIAQLSQGEGERQ